MSVVTFENAGAGREIARLGSVEIGWVLAVDRGRGRVAHSWRVTFGTNASVEIRNAGTGHQAKRGLVYRLADLFELCGPAFEKIAHAARAQADAMERS